MIDLHARLGDAIAIFIGLIAGALVVGIRILFATAAALLIVQWVMATAAAAGTGGCA